MPLASAARTALEQLVAGQMVELRQMRSASDRYGRMLADAGTTPVIIGVASEADLGATIKLFCSRAIDLTGKTAIGDVFALARNAAIVIGNDTGPMHLAALSGTPCVILFGPESDPALTAPRGPKGEWLAVLRTDDLRTLPAEDVFARASALMKFRRS